MGCLGKTEVALYLGNGVTNGQGYWAGQRMCGGRTFLLVVPDTCTLPASYI
jgi:hypothetical protein